MRAVHVPTINPTVSLCQYITQQLGKVFVKILGENFRISI